MLHKAFYECYYSLRFIRFSRNLEFIGIHDFEGCTSLDAVFLPPTIWRIDDYAFQSCESLSFFNVPEYFHTHSIGDNVIWGCDELLTTFKYGDAKYGLTNNCKSESMDDDLM